MSTFKSHLEEKKQEHPEVFKNFEQEYLEFKIQEIAAMLRTERKKAGLTQEGLALLAHTQKQAISRLENQRGNITISTLWKVSKALGKHLEVSLR